MLASNLGNQIGNRFMQSTGIDNGTKPTFSVSDKNVCIVGTLGQHARYRPDHPAIEDGQRIVTYRDLDNLVGQAAANLRKQNVQIGDFVALMLGNNADHLIILCALARVGAIVCSINPQQSISDICSNIEQLDVSLIITSAPTKPIAGFRMLSDAEILRPSEEVILENFSTGDRPVLLQQSSGTTGRPKNALLSHRDFLYRMNRSHKLKGITQAERFLSMTDMNFAWGRNTYLEMLHLGATIIVNNAQTASEVIAFVNEKRVSYLILTASLLLPLLAMAKTDKLLFPDLGVMLVSSSRTKSEHRVLARKHLTPNFFETLGCNEAGLLAQADPRDQDAHPNSLGRIADGIEAHIVDSQGNILPDGEIGLVGFRGLGLTTEYLNNPEATAKTFRDGWFYPGDVATLNEDGYLFFKGRADDVINNAGIKFYPIEIENILLSHPAVAEAAVFPWPHKIAGQLAGAAIVLQGDVTYEELKTYCAARLAPYKVPYVIDFRKTLPKNSAGKVLKRELAKQLQARSRRSINARSS